MKLTKRHRIVLAMLLIVFVDQAVCETKHQAEKPSVDGHVKNQQPNPGAGKKQRQRPPQEFIPSEKIGPDSSVAFPIDI